jgi:hypothetical protein
MNFNSTFFQPLIMQAHVLEDSEGLLLVIVTKGYVWIKIKDKKYWWTNQTILPINEIEGTVTLRSFLLQHFLQIADLPVYKSIALPNVKVKYMDAPNGKFKTKLTLPKFVSNLQMPNINIKIPIGLLNLWRHSLQIKIKNFYKPS